jgi:hypothetical protein
VLLVFKTFKAYVELEAEKKIKCLRINMLKEYRLWDPTAYKIAINKDVIFMEDKIQMEENDNTLKETTTVQVENT